MDFDVYTVFAVEPEMITQVVDLRIARRKSCICVYKVSKEMRRYEIINAMKRKRNILKLLHKYSFCTNLRLNSHKIVSISNKCLRKNQQNEDDFKLTFAWNNDNIYQKIGHGQ